MIPDVPALDATKIALRAQALAARDGVSGEARRQFAARLAELGPELAVSHGVRMGQTVGIFFPMRSEPDTTDLIAALVGAGFATALPVVVERHQALAFRRWKPGDPLHRAPFGMAEPEAMAAPLTPDILFVPLAAFDRSGHRIGYGGGYYDRTLALMRRTRAVPAIGVAFACQEVAEVPVEAHDESLDALITERELVSFAAPPR